VDHANSHHGILAASQDIITQPLSIEMTPSESILRRNLFLGLPFFCLLYQILGVPTSDIETDSRHTLGPVSRRLAINRDIATGVQIVQQNGLDLLLMWLRRREHALQVGDDLGQRLRQLVRRAREHQLVVERGGRVEVVAQRAQVRLRRCRRIQHCAVRPVHLQTSANGYKREWLPRRTSHLVPAEAVEVHAQVFDIDPAVRRVRHPIHADQRAGHGVHRLRNGLDIMQSPEDVGDVRDGDELRAGRQQLVEVGDAQLRVGFGRRHAPPADHEAQAVGDVDPRRGVRLVVELAQHQLVARREVQRRRQVAEELRRR